jgi:hemerythrin-like metal-binding protein
MQNRKKKFLTPGIDIDILDHEHSNIHRQYLELDDAILYGQGSPRILEAALALAQYMGMHFTHEEQFRKNIAFPARQNQRSAWKKNMAELLQIESGLKQQEVYAALRLRGFCKGWMQEHMDMEGAEFEIVGLTVIPEASRVQA